MMSWAEFLSHLLQSSHKVDKAAVFNTQGQPLATTEDLHVSDSDGRAILHCLKDPARSLTCITIDETTFRCFQGNDNALVGMATNRKGRVLVARLTEEALVVVMGLSAGHGSFLFEVQKNLKERTRRQMAPQGPVSGAGATSQQAMSPTDKKLFIPPPSSPVGQEQVLVQLHD
ncbi:uncharacterized protein [Littorina saxatilis]|uniref:Uncharacterized protein n=1 Tax=Littorina saxatilis TaxID=31220 RepID=A0AAN9B600_9CAEN